MRPRQYELRGERRTARQWAELHGLPYALVASRLSKGASIEEALAPVGTHGGLRTPKPKRAPLSPTYSKDQQIEDAILALRRLVVVRSSRDNEI